MKLTPPFRPAARAGKKTQVLSLHTLLTRQIWLCVLPLVLLAGYLAFSHILSLQTQRDEEAADQARNVATAIDRQISSQIAALQVLAASPLVDDPPRLEEFYNQARAFRESLGGHVILADLSTQMLFYTREPFGAALPKLPRPRGHAAAPAVLETGKPAVGDMFFGRMAGEQLVAVVVPVIRNEQTKLLLLSIIETRQFQHRLDEVSLPAGWSLTVLDGKHEVIARRSPPKTEGDQEGQEPSRRFVAKSNLSHWSVVLEVPRRVYLAPIIAVTVALVAAILAATFVSVTGGRLASRRLARSVAALAETPLHQTAPPVIEEIEAVRRNLVAASAAREEAEQRIEHLNRVLRSIRDVNQLILREKNPDRLIREACKLLVDNQGYGTALIVLTDDADVPRSFAEAGTGHVFQSLADKLNRGELPPCCEEARSHEDVYLVTDHRKVCGLCPLGADYLSGHSMCIPLRHEEKTYGYLAVSAASGIACDDEALSLFAELAGDIAFALRTIELAEQATLSVESVRRSEEKYRSLVESISDVIYEIDSEGIISYVSPAVRTVLGYEPEEVIGKTFTVFVYPEDRGLVTKRFEDLIEGVENLTECRLMGKFGEIRWVQTLGKPTMKAGNFSGARGTIIDITERKKAVVELHESEERFRLAFENANVGVCLVDTEGRLLRVNDQLCKILGYNRQELEAMNVNDLVIPDDRDVSPYSLHGALAEQATSAEFERRLFHKQGHIIHCRIASSLVQDARGRPLYFISHVQDVTERKRVEEALQKRVIALTQPLDDPGVIQLSDLFDVGELQRIQDAFAEATGVASLITAPDGTPITQPSNFCRLCGEIIRQTEKGLANCFKSDAAIGRYNPSGPIVRACLSGGLWDAGASITVGGRHIANWLVGQVRNEELDEERMLAYAQEIGADPEEFAKALAEVPVMSREQFEKVARALFCFANELSLKAYQNVQQARFIADRQKAEALRMRLVTAIEQAAEGVVITGADGKIQYVNPALEKMTGYDSKELIGKTPRVLKSGEHDQAFYQKLWETITHGDVWAGRFVNKRKDGRLYHEEATISPVREASGKIVNFVAVKRDITEHLELSKQLQQAQKMEAVGTLAGGIAHDFNNLLQAILGYSELVLSDDDLPHQFRDDLEKVVVAGKNGADLVRRLLTFSRKTETQPLYLDLNQRIRQTRKFLQRTIPKMIDIELILAEDLATVHADPTQMDQMIMNLAVNARDAMPDGGKLLIETANVVVDDEYARSHLEAKPGRYVLLRVSDTGSGMGKETLEHIFEPFYTTKGPGEGTGLGLAMVYGIVQRHHGFINCYSEVGHGTTFKIYLPSVTSETRLAEPIVATVPRGGTETILLVDDEELIRNLGERILTKAGYTVLTARDGKEALAIYQQEQSRIALVILDLIMPGMGGKKCLEEILAISPQAKVVLASGHSANGLAKDAVRAGAKGYVDKPYDVHQILQMVRDVLDGDEGTSR